MELNFDAVVRLTEALLPLLRALGAERDRQRRRAPPAGSRAPARGAYSASKFALIGWSDSLYAEERAHGVHVGLVLPGFIATEGFPAERAARQAADALARLDAREGRRGDRRGRPRRQGRALRAAPLRPDRRPPRPRARPRPPDHRRRRRRRDGHGDEAGEVGHRRRVGHHRRRLPCRDGRTGGPLKSHEYSPVIGSAGSSGPSTSDSIVTQAIRPPSAESAARDVHRGVEAVGHRVGVVEGVAGEAGDQRRTATASRPATRETALLMPEAIPEWRDVGGGEHRRRDRRDDEGQADPEDDHRGQDRGEVVVAGVDRVIISIPSAMTSGPTVSGIRGADPLREGARAGREQEHQDRHRKRGGAGRDRRVAERRSAGTRRAGRRRRRAPRRRRR